jgi:hypothetical protein
MRISWRTPRHSHRAAAALQLPVSVLTVITPWAAKMSCALVRVRPMWNPSMKSLGHRHRGRS